MFTADNYYIYTLDKYSISIEGNEDLIDAFSNLIEKEQKYGIEQITESIRQQLLVCGMSKTQIIIIMTMLQDDIPAMRELLFWANEENPTSETIMNEWVRNYLIRHPEKQDYGKYQKKKRAKELKEMK